MRGLKKPLTIRDRQRQRRRSRIIRITLLLIFLLSVLFGIYYFITERLAYGDIQVEGTNLVSKDEVVSSINTTLKYKILHFISTNNIVFSSHARVQGELLNQFPEIESVAINSVWSFSEHPSIRAFVNERRATALWCEGVLESPESCFVMDKDGYVFGTSSLTSESDSGISSTFLIFEGSLKDGDAIRQHYVLPQAYHDLTTFIKDVGDYTRNYGIKPVRLVSPSIGEYELFFDNNESLKFSDQRPYDKTLENIKMILSQSEVRSAYYIDARYGNKIFYLPRGTTTSITSTSTASTTH